MNIENPKKARGRFWTRERFLQIGAIVLTVTLCACILIFYDHIIEFKQYGYIGLFLISILSSSSIVLPIPGWFIIATMGSVLNPILVGIISAVGGTIGEMTGYMLGYGGRIAVHESPMYCRIERWMKKWGTLTIFALALIPNPLFDIAISQVLLPAYCGFLYGSFCSLVLSGEFPNILPSLMAVLFLPGTCN